MYISSLLNLGNTHEVVREYVQDPELVAQLNEFQKQNAALLAKYEELVKRMEDQQIETFEDLQKFDQKGAEALVRLATETAPLQMQGRNFGFFGLTSTGKSTIINKLVGKSVAEVGAGETTTKIQPYEGLGYRLYDIPGRNDDISYFSMEYVAFWKALTARVVVVTTTVKEMTKVFRLLDAINLQYDIVVNKFDLVKLEERETVKTQVRQQIVDCKLQGVNRVWFVSAENPRQFPDWIAMVDYLTNA
jgi:small GTP-binding protein